MTPTQALRHRASTLSMALVAAAAVALATVPNAFGKAPAASASIADVAALLAGRYDNSSQVVHGKDEHPPPQHVTITIEPTARSDWQIWRVHMDVDPEVAQEAGSDTSLDAAWAMNITQTPRGMELVPYTSKPSLDPTSMQASAFDESQWLSLAACALGGRFDAAGIAIRAPADEMCVAATMGLGGKRAFLPTSVARSGDDLQVTLIYFGRPWLVDARRI